MAPSHLHRGAAKRCCSTSAPAVRSACRTAERMPSQPRTRSAWRPDASFDMYLLHGSVGEGWGVCGANLENDWANGYWRNGSWWVLRIWIKLLNSSHSISRNKCFIPFLRFEMVWNQHVRRKTDRHRWIPITFGTPGHHSLAHETKHLLNRQGSDWFARADVLPNLANRPTLVLFLPAKHLWMCGVITCTLVFLHLFKPLVRISSDQLPRDANSNAEKKLVHHPTLPKLFGKPQCSVASSHYLHRTWVWSICIQSKSHSTTHASRVKKME